MNELEESDRAQINKDLILGVLLNCFNVNQLNVSNMTFTRKIEKSVTLWQNPFEMS